MSMIIVFTSGDTHQARLGLRGKLAEVLNPPPPGSTLTAMLVSGGVLITVANLGDSDAVSPPSL